MLKRPSKQDTEEDLLRFQEEFLASKTAPSVSVIRKPEKRKSGETNSGKSEDISLEESKPESQSLPPEKKVCFQEGEEDADERLEKHDQHITKVLSEIVERDFKNPPVYFPEALLQGGFPKVLHRGAHSQTEEDVKPEQKKSIFAQQLEKSGARKFGVNLSKRTSKTVSAVVTEKQPLLGPNAGESTLVSGEGLNQNNPTEEVKSIHEENLGRMATMTQEELLKEQAELLRMLDPGMVSFLKKRQQNRETNKSTKKEPMSSDYEMETVTANTLIQEQDANTKATSETDKSANLPVKPDTTWVNMDKIEYDKLEWTKALPAPKAGDKSTGQPVRFDFKGHVIDSDADVPVHLGLHHHGVDPEQAGYSLEEIYQLCRSTNMQQRVMALNMLAAVIRNARSGQFKDKTSAFVIPALLNSGLLFILRWALDDSTEGTMVAAVNLLHAVIVCVEDEAGLDLTFHWYRGHQVQRLQSQVQDLDSVPGAEDGEDEAQKTDADVVKRDVIQGLMRMSLLPRLRFVLTKWKPAPRVVVQILEILIRIARHSTQTAFQIVQCAGLIEAIFQDFLPLHWTPVPPDSGPPLSVYGYPIPRALKLMRVLSTAGRHMASNLLHSHQLAHCLTRYICDETDNLQLYDKEGDLLYVETLRTWQVCASYGLVVDSLYEQLYPVLIKKLQSLYVSSNISSTKSCALVTVLESIVQVAASVTMQRMTQLKNQNKAMSMGERDITVSLPDINWSKVTGLYQPIISLLENALQDFTNKYFESKFDLTYISCLLNFASTFISQSEYQPGYAAVDTITELTQMSDACILPCLKSQAFSQTLRYLREYSVLLLSTEGTRGEVPSNLPEVGSLCGNIAAPCPVLNPQTTVQFCSAITRLLLTLGKINKTLIEQLFPIVLQHEEVLQYVRKLCLWQKKAPHATNYFAKFENQLQYNLINMARQAAKVQVDTKLYHQMSLYLFIHLHQGDEYLAHSLLSTVIFNTEFMSDVSYNEEEEVARIGLDESLKLEEEKYLQSATSQLVRKRKVDLILDSCGHVQSVRNTYLEASAGLVRSLQQSRNRALPNPLDIDKLHSGDVGELLVPVDWAFLPLIEVYNSSQNREPSGDASKLLRQSVVLEEIVLNTLRWLFVLEGWRPGVLDSVSLTLKLSRILCIFLAGNDLFLNDSIHGYLLSLLKIYCKSVNLARLNLEEKVPGLTSFYDFYITLVGQFEAVSFGDPLFAGYVLLAQQQCHNIKYRTAVWGEHCDVLTAINLQLNQVIIPIKQFLEPEEESRELLRLYMQALLSGTVTPARNPLPYLIAVHHVNRFIYTQDGKSKKLKEAYIKQIGCTKNKVLRHDVLLYKKFNTELYRLELYNVLPNNRQQLLQTLNIIV